MYDEKARSHLAVLAIFLFLSACESRATTREFVGKYSCEIPEGFIMSENADRKVYFNRNIAGVPSFEINGIPIPDSIPDGSVEVAERGVINGIDYESRVYTLKNIPPMVYHISWFGAEFAYLANGDLSIFKQFLESCKISNSPPRG